MAGYLPVSNAVMNVFSFAANAAETGTYGYLIYTDYGDYIAITDCDTLAETYEYTFKTVDSIPLGDVNSDSIVDARDASVILSYYAYTATGGTGSLKEFLDK